jgi:hypothetical protein
VDLGLARVKRTEAEFREIAETIIINTRRGIERMMRSGLIPPFPKSMRTARRGRGPSPSSPFGRSPRSTGGDLHG